VKPKQSPGSDQGSDSKSCESALTPRPEKDQIDHEKGSRRWYLIFSKPRQETTARTHLERQGYDVYLPLVEQRKKRLGRARTVLEPLFSRYLFIHLDSHTDDWRPIRSTIGVSKLVRFGQDPAPVPDGLIAVIRQRENDAGVVPLSSVRASMQAGDSVRITEGAMAGFDGIFLAQTSRDRVHVLLDLMGTRSRVSLPIDTIAPDR